MRSFLRATALPLALLGFGVLACAVAVRCDRQGGEEPNPAGAQSRRRELDRQLEATHARREARHRLAGELIEGRLTLAEATDEFMRLNREEPNTAANIHLMFPGADERQSTARQVLIYAEDALEERRDLTPEARRRVLERLEAELRKMYE